MKILGLPGRHPANGPWMEQVLAAIDAPDASRYNQAYAIWQNPAAELDENHEIDRAAAVKADLIVAKSLGTILTALGIEQGKLQPTHLVLIGLPLVGLDDEELTWFKNLAQRKLSVLFIQQTRDPGGSFAEITRLFSQAGHTVVEVPGDDHMYRDVERLGDVINGWFS